MKGRRSASQPPIEIPVLPPSEPANTWSGSIWASAPNMQSTMRKPVRPRAAQAAGSTALAIVPGGAIDLDGAEHALIVRDLGRQHRADRAIARRFGEGKRVVDRALDLGRRAGPVDRDTVACLADRDRERDRPADIDAVVVDMVEESGRPRPAIRGSRRASGARSSRSARSCNASACAGPYAWPGRSSAVSAMWQAASWARRSPNTLTGTRTLRSIKCPERVVARAAVVELKRRDAQPLLIDLGRVRGVRAGHPAADIGMVADRPGIGEQAPPS